jgi:hypothetical protein
MEIESTRIPNVGRKLQWTEECRGRFAAGTFARIEKVRRKDLKESRTDLIRLAVERELERRESIARGSTAARRLEAKLGKKKR